MLFSSLGCININNQYLNINNNTKNYDPSEYIRGVIFLNKPKLNNQKDVLNDNYNYIQKKEESKQIDNVNKDLDNFNIETKSKDNLNCFHNFQNCKVYFPEINYPNLENNYNDKYKDNDTKDIFTNDYNCCYNKDINDLNEKLSSHLPFNESNSNDNIYNTINLERISYLLEQYNNKPTYHIQNNSNDNIFQKIKINEVSKNDCSNNLIIHKLDGYDNDINNSKFTAHFENEIQNICNNNTNEDIIYSFPKLDEFKIEIKNNDLNNCNNTELDTSNNFNLLDQSQAPVVKYETPKAALMQYKSEFNSDEDDKNNNLKNKNLNKQNTLKLDDDTFKSIVVSSDFIGHSPNEHYISIGGSNLQAASILKEDDFRVNNENTILISEYLNTEELDEENLSSFNLKNSKDEYNNEYDFLNFKENDNLNNTVEVE